MNTEKIYLEAQIQPSCLGAVSGSSFVHYMIYVNGKFVKDVYSFDDLQQYYDRYFLYDKITHEKV